MRYEYKQITVSDLVKLNELAADGWRVVSVHTCLGGTAYAMMEKKSHSAVDEVDRLRNILQSLYSVEIEPEAWCAFVLLVHFVSKAVSIWRQRNND